MLNNGRYGINQLRKKSPEGEEDPSTNPYRKEIPVGTPSLLNKFCLHRTHPLFPSPKSHNEPWLGTKGKGQTRNLVSWPFFLLFQLIPLRSMIMEDEKILKNLKNFSNISHLEMEHNPLLKSETQAWSTFKHKEEKNKD